MLASQNKGGGSKFNSLKYILLLWKNKCLLNPLTTNDAIWHSLTLAACYQLPQSVLKIGFALAKKAGQVEVGGFQHGVLCTWQLPWLAVEKPWSALAGPFLTLLAQTGSRTTPLPL